MALVDQTQLGEQWVWGFQDPDAPNIVNGFEPTDADIKWEPEKYSTSENGEGMVDSVTVTQRSKRKGTATYNGRITEDYDPLQVPESFVFNGRRWIVKNASDPRKKGDYAEVSIECESFYLVD